MKPFDLFLTSITFTLCVCARTYMWRSEDHMWQQVSLLPPCGSQELNWNQLVRLGGQCFTQLVILLAPWYLLSLFLLFFFPNFPQHSYRHCLPRRIIWKFSMLLNSSCFVSKPTFIFSTLEILSLALIHTLLMWLWAEVDREGLNTFPWLSENARWSVSAE